MRKIVMVLSLLLFGATVVFAQISGKVTDADGKPVERASVFIKGTATGTAADNSGSFKINAKPGDILVVSSLNFITREINIGNGNDLSISLSRSEAKLDEVMVTTALGIRRSRNSLPYATQQVSSAEVNKTMNTNFVDNLSGKVSGLLITSSNTTGGSTNAILRGFKSLTQNNQALFVVDGVPYDNTNQSNAGYDLGNAASDINPEDIESVSVLKGAAASALYGSRASNGVILINTKKGSKRKGVGVSVTSGVTVGSPDKSTLPVYQTQYGQGYGSQGYSSAYPDKDGFFYYQPTFTSNGQPVEIVQTDVDAATGPAYDASKLVYNWDAFSKGDPNYGKATPWKPADNHNATDFFATPVTTRTNIYLDGGGDNGTFKAGITRSEDKGILPNSHVTKTQLNFGATQNINDKITVGVQVNYSDVVGVGRDGYTSSSSQNPMLDFREWWPSNINVKQQKADYFKTLTNASWNWLGGYEDPSTQIVAYHNNPYWNRYQNTEGDDRKRYFGNVNVNYNITSHLNLLARVSLDNYDQDINYHVAKGSVHTASYSTYTAGYGETNYDLLLTYDQKITHTLNLKALVGSNIRQQNNSSNSATTLGGLVVPGLYTLANSKQTPAAPVETQSTKEVDGIFAGVTLSYKALLTLDATLRRDRSSTLPTANNTYYYPSVSGNFVFSKLLPQLNWLSYGKLRANYAEVGGDAPVFSLDNTYQNVSPFNGQTVFAAPITNNNKNLLPETNRTYEFGIEASFLNNRLGFDVTYYYAREINQILPISVSTASGFSQFFVNGGTVQNKGFEVSVNATPVKTKDFSWNINFNWSKNQNTVLSLYNNQPSYTIANYGFSTQLVAVQGQPYGVIRGTDYLYKDGKKLVDANGYYELNPNSKSNIGNINPDWIGAVNNSLTYKDWGFSFLIDVHQGGKVYSLDKDFGDYSGLYPETAGKNDLGNPVRDPLAKGGGIILPGVTEDGKANTVRVDASDINQGAFPFSSYNSMAGISYVYDASYVKLREVAITYSVPVKSMHGMGFVKGIDISLTGRNLWIIHKNLPYSDPEQGYSSGNASIGFQVGAYPSIRTAGLNVKLKF